MEGHSSEEANAREEEEEDLSKTNEKMNLNAKGVEKY